MSVSAVKLLCPKVNKNGCYSELLRKGLGSGGCYSVCGKTSQLIP